MARERVFDDVLYSVRSPAALAGMAATWGGTAATTAWDMISAIRAGLDDPTRIQAVAASLSAREQAALAILKRLGGTAEAGALALALLVAGFPCAPPTGLSISPDLADMIQRGLVLRDSSYEPFSSETRYDPCRLFADHRLLTTIDAIPLVPLAITPVPAPAVTVLRHPARVVLDILAVLQTVDRQGGLSLTQQGTVRVADQRRLTRALGWDDQPPFSGALALLIHVLWIGGLLTRPRTALVVHPDADRLLRQSDAALIHHLVPPWIDASDWYEGPGLNHPATTRGRLAVVTALTALPPGDDFFALDAFSQVLFARIGERFALAGTPQLPRLRRSVYDDPPPTAEAWRAHLRARWAAHEQAWIGRVFSTWLAFLGLVELGLEDGMPVTFRLTPLGRAIFQLTPAASGAAPVPPAPAWVVQPNFEIVTYLERARGEQLALIEHYGERLQVDAHTARHRLTHESVYQGLERRAEATIADLLAALRAGAVATVPVNVEATLRAWGQQREQVKVYRQARLLEFRDAKARQVALDSGLDGTTVGERFVLLNGPIPDKRGMPRIDYTKARPACLTVTETGELTLAKPPDLFLVAQLTPWTESVADGTWRFTAARMRAAVAAGRSLDNLLPLLSDRLTHTLPPVLEVALRAWAGARPVGTLETVLVLRCPEPGVARAIAESPLFRPAIRGRLGPTTLLVAMDQVEGLREQLAWLGFDLDGAT